MDFIAIKEQLFFCYQLIILRVITFDNVVRTAWKDIQTWFVVDAWMSNNFFFMIEL